ncbi:uncharacterized protein F5147DRAFT_562098, partial [Suillus discolor]
PASDVLNIFSWILTGLSNYPPPRSVQKGALTLQSSGSGSCGIVAHNFVESLVDESVPYWDNVSSLEFRKKALQEIIIYHDAAARTSVIFLDWVRPCLNNEVQSNCSEDFVGFNDFNLYIPLASHPIYKFKT